MIFVLSNIDGVSISCGFMNVAGAIALIMANVTQRRMPLSVGGAVEG
jgi:hypothetical protein